MNSGIGEEYVKSFSLLLRDWDLQFVRAVVHFGNKIPSTSLKSVRYTTEYGVIRLLWMMICLKWLKIYV